jgi:lysophospholipase L1-like esterase
MATSDQVRTRGTSAHGRIVALSMRLAVALLAASLCVGVLEFAFRIVGYRPLYDLYSKPEIFWRKDPLLGWSQEPNATGTYVGPRPFPVEFHSRVRINSLGLRGPELTPKSTGSQRVLVLGDSVVAAFEVDEDQTFLALAARDLTARLRHPVEVVNAGVRGYGTDQSYLYFKERGRLLRPDVVVFVAASNDPDDNMTLHRGKRPFGKPAFALKSDGSLELVGVPIPDYSSCEAVRLDNEYRPTAMDTPTGRLLCGLQTRLSDHSALFTFAALRIQQNPQLMHRLFGLTAPEDAVKIGITSVGEHASQPSALTTALIRQLARAVRDAGARFLLAINDYDLVSLDSGALKTDQVECVVFPPAANSAAYQWKNDGHLNEAGHRRFAGLLEPELAKELRTAEESAVSAPPVP